MVCISPSMSLRGVVATKQSQNEIATPFGLAMTTFYGSECKLFYALGNNFYVMFHDGFVTLEP